jgi:hypothetical protein
MMRKGVGYRNALEVASHRGDEAVLRLLVDKGAHIAQGGG